MKEDAKKKSGEVDPQKVVDAEEEQGFRGVKVDPTPDANYSMLTPPDAPTPETDAGAAAAAREATGLGISGLEAKEKEGGKK